MSKTPRPPLLPLRFFRWFCHPDYVEDIEGDLLERFEKRACEKDAVKGNLWFLFEIIKLFRPALMKTFIRPTQSVFGGFFIHYSRISFRIFFLNRLITLFSLLCLIVASISITLMSTWTENELSMNEFHSKKSRIKMLMLKANPMSKPRGSWLGLDPSKGYPEVEKGLQIQVYNQNEEAQIEINGKATSLDLWVVDSTFFDFFDFQLLYGDPTTAWKHPQNILLSKRMSQRLFGNTNPLDNIVKLRCEEALSYKVAGVFDKMPGNSSLNFDAVVSNSGSKVRWSRMGTNLILVSNGFDQVTLDDKIKHNARNRPKQGNSYSESEMFTIGFDEIYFNNAFYTNVFSKFGSMKVVRNMELIALIVLMIAAFGFTSLQQLQQLNSNRSMAIRCINGASKANLFLEICISRFYLLLSATLLSTTLLTLIFPYFNALINTDLDFDFIQSLRTAFFIGATLVSTSLILSLFHVYQFEIIQAFQKRAYMASVPFIQRAVTVLQYTATTALLVATLIAYCQYDFMINKDIGIETENIVSAKMNYEMLIDKTKSREELMSEYESKNEDYRYALNELKSFPAILAVSQGEKPLSGSAYPMEHKIIGGETDYATHNIMTVDPDYEILFDLEIAEGRFFNDSIDKSRGKQVVINEAAKKYWNIESINGTSLKNESWGKFEIIGVVKDFNYEHLVSNVEPLVMYYMADMENNFLIKVQKGKDTEALAFIEEVHTRVSPNQWFSYNYFNEELAHQYDKERLTMKIYLAFTSVAIILSFTSLFAFAWSENKRRIKELGIRKVHGALSYQLFTMLGFSFFKLVIIAFVLACPIVWYLMSSWLDDYYYRIDIEIWHFAIGGLTALIISFFAVVRQTWSVVSTNPVNILRYE